MIFGAIWAVGGTTVTIVTYQIAASSPVGGHYFIAWGAIAFGLYDFFKGLAGYTKYKSEFVRADQISTGPIKCPNCGLVNPPDAIMCDCSFNFKQGQIEDKV
ncbi:MAG: hypothetical protein GY797_27000 [Deltaproteobacteria bacterium]|nr:hypothetical protein [Deltaproteobacteria bacterium]